MEGLIPMLFKAVKKNKIRRQYRCLSMGAAQTYNLADFYDYGEHDQYHHQGGKLETTDAPRPRTEARNNEFEGRSKGHRRYGSSVGEYGVNGERYDERYGVVSPPKQIIKRYTSHRMFSCITANERNVNRSSSRSREGGQSDEIPIRDGNGPEPDDDYEFDDEESEDEDFSVSDEGEDDDMRQFVDSDV
ncbi:hypothetical protein SOVF_137250 [Spinacia oleracea]|nr:hypothetical protein SOVF_137250 [Spinacia oleracea]